VVFGRPETARFTALAIALAAACALGALLAATASAATNWTPPRELSAAGKDASEPLVAMDPAGNITVIWERETPSGVGRNLQVSTRAATGGDFTAPADLALRAAEPRMAMAPNGDLYMLWRQFEASTSRYAIRMVTKPPGGPISAPVTVYQAPVGGFPTELDLAVGAGGDVAVAWSDVDPAEPFAYIVCGFHHEIPIPCPNPSFVMATVRPAGGVFQPATRLFPLRGKGTEGETPLEKEEREKDESGLRAFGPRAAVDPAGNVIVAYTYSDHETPAARYSYRPAGDDFSAAEPLGPPGEESTVVDVGMDGAGNTVAAWVSEAGAQQTLKAAVRPPGGKLEPFQQLGAISDPGSSAEDPSLDVAQDGTATLLWRLPGVIEGGVRARVRPPGGAFLPEERIGGGLDNPRFPRLARNAAGDEIVVWSGNSGANEIARASVRRAGGGFSVPVGISQGTPENLRPQPAIDASGNGVVVWVRPIGGDFVVQVTGYDAQPPQLSGVSIPSGATVGEPIGLSGAASDLWGVTSVAADFGDGTQSGLPASHAYSKPGSYPVTVTATDGVGRTTVATGTVLVKARNSFTIGKLKRNRRKGTATLSVTIPEPGTVTAGGKGLRKASVSAAAGGTVTLLLKAGGKGQKRLKRKGKLAARLNVSYLPEGGDPSSKQLRVILRKKR
jgi:PKD domain